LSEAENGLVDSPATVYPATVYFELWTSLASMMRSYMAAHGLHRGHADRNHAGPSRTGQNQTVHADWQVEWDAAHILTRYRDKWLDLKRDGTRVTWMRENGNSGVLVLTEAGRLRGAGLEQEIGQEIDMAAEAWARELMG